MTTLPHIEGDANRLQMPAMAQYLLGHAKESQQALDELISRHSADYAYNIAQIYARRHQTKKCVCMAGSRVPAAR
jgi:hypothetical protein